MKDMLFWMLVVSMTPWTIIDLGESLDRGFVTFSFLLMFASILVGYLYSKVYSTEEFLIIFERSVFYLCAIALPLFVLVCVYPEIVGYFFRYKYGEFTNRSAVFLNVLGESDIIFRNAGFASEPGYFQFFLNLALFITLRRSGRINLRSGLYVAAIVSTQSTMGLAIMALVILMFTRGWARIAVIGCAVGAFGTISNLAEVHYQGKIENEYALSERMDPFVNAANVILERPLGIGAYEYTSIYENLNIGSWDSYTQVGLRYGTVTLFIVALLIGRIAKHSLGLAMIIFATFLTSPIWYLPVVSCFYFLFSRIEPKARVHGISARATPIPEFQNGWWVGRRG
ncbi:hypothetical protein [Mesorhizobium sp.]|uniref:hypothetical protein n=1 Tax=Mesorhizobium sp. TaxID=1871066 RepID=UPI000FE76375|nr:hypothetical protein [Mesorhizobium sp.]RWP38397.1 MAG: hypothetical protein EOR03_02765 [Mesorhizobium sp.]